MEAVPSLVPHVLRHFSVSQVRTFLTCPRRHAYRYVESVESEYRPVSLAFGTAWHEAVGGVLRRLATEEPQLSVAKESFRVALLAEIEGEGEDEPPVLFDTEEQNLRGLLEKGEKMMTALFDQIDWPKRVLDVELPFALTLLHPRTGEPLPIPLVGSMDAWVEDESGPVVWELKTAARKWSKAQLAHDAQAVAYRLATESMGRPSPVKLLVMTKTATPELQVDQPEVTRSDTRELAGVVASVHRAIVAGVDHPIRGWHCAGCPYKGRCR